MTDLVFGRNLMIYVYWNGVIVLLKVNNCILLAYKSELNYLTHLHPFRYLIFSYAKFFVLHPKILKQSTLTVTPSFMTSFKQATIPESQILCTKGIPSEGV